MSKSVCVCEGRKKTELKKIHCIPEIDMDNIVFFMYSVRIGWIKDSSVK